MKTDETRLALAILFTITAVSLLVQCAAPGVGL